MFYLCSIGDAQYYPIFNWIWKIRFLVFIVYMSHTFCFFFCSVLLQTPIRSFSNFALMIMLYNSDLWMLHSFSEGFYILCPFFFFFFLVGKMISLGPVSCSYSLISQTWTLVIQRCQVFLSAHLTMHVSINL